MVRLDSVLSSWKTIREDTAQAVEDFSAHDLNYKPTADVMSFGEIARHILEASHALTGLLLDGVDNLAHAAVSRNEGQTSCAVAKDRRGRRARARTEEPDGKTGG